MSSNPYFNFTTPLTRQTLARSASINSLFQAVADGFSLVGEFGSQVIINPQEGTAYTLVTEDSDKLIRFTNSDAITLTVPAQADVAFSVGTQIILESFGMGVLSIAPDDGVTINGEVGNFDIVGRWTRATLLKTDTNAWVVTGISKAATADWHARATNKVLTADGLPGAKEPVPLAYSATRSLMWTDGWFRTTTMTGNMLLSNPSSVEQGDTIYLFLIGDSATERSITFGTNYKGNLPDETVTSTQGLLVSLFAATATVIIASYVVFET